MYICYQHYKKWNFFVVMSNILFAPHVKT
jgi:hypothetical protein